MTVDCRPFNEPDGLRDSHTTPTTREMAVEIVVADTGCGIPNAKLEEIFRQFEQVEHENEEQQQNQPGLGEPDACLDLLEYSRRSLLGLGLAVVARIVEQVGGQLRVDSNEGGSRFSFLLPFTLPDDKGHDSSSLIASRPGSHATGSEVDDFVTAMSASHMVREPQRKTSPTSSVSQRPLGGLSDQSQRPTTGVFYVQDSHTGVRGVKMDSYLLDRDHIASPSQERGPPDFKINTPAPATETEEPSLRPEGKLRVLVVEVSASPYYRHDRSQTLTSDPKDEPVNSMLMRKRLTKWNHVPVAVWNGQEAKDLLGQDFDFDCVLMDLQ